MTSTAGQAPRDASPRVVFICPSLQIGGAQRHLSVLVPALRERGLESRVIAIRDRGPFFDELLMRGIDTRFIRVASRFDLAGIWRVASDVAHWPHVVVSQGLDAQLVGAVVSRRARVPHLTVYHGQPELVPSPHRRLLTRLIARDVKTVIAVTEAQVPTLLGGGFRTDQISIIENGVPEPTVSRDRGKLRRELKLGSNDFVALLAATLRPEKRARIFIDAVQQAHQENPRIRGVIAGGGSDLPIITARAGSGGIVRVLGPRSDLVDVMAACDVVCLTSAAEALPMVVLEAMALAKPVISTAVGGIAGVVIDGLTGRLTEVDDGQQLKAVLIELASDAVAVAEMGRAARSRYGQHYASDIMADRYADVLHRFVPQGL